MELNLRLEMDVKKIVGRLGMEERGRVQRYIDSEVMRMCDKYVPFDTGTLKNSVQINTVIGSGKVVYNTPYARRWYYMPAQFEGAPTRGNYWGQRALQEGGKEQLLRGIKQIVRR